MMARIGTQRARLQLALVAGLVVSAVSLGVALMVTDEIFEAISAAGSMAKANYYWPWIWPLLNTNDPNVWLDWEITFSWIVISAVAIAVIVGLMMLISRRRRA